MRGPEGASVQQCTGATRPIPELALTLAATPAVQAGAVRDVAPSAVLERMRAKFPTAAVAVLELTGNWNQLTPGAARLICFVTPRDLAAS
jgi:phosphohistidine phosphatase